MKDSSAETKPKFEPYICRVIPPGSTGTEQFTPLTGLLSPAERILLSPRASRRRIAEFTAGRTCAREALQRLNCSEPNVLRGIAGEPKWPIGFVGSITHCETYCAAAAASSQHYAALGIDAEPNLRLTAEILPLIATRGELLHLNELPSSLVNWDRLLFSAKEAIYKTWAPITGLWLDFEDVTITFRPEDNRFMARVMKPHAFFPKELVGKFHASTALLLTATFVALSD